VNFDEVAQRGDQGFEVNLKVFCFFRPFIEISSKTPDTKDFAFSNGKSGLNALGFPHYPLILFFYVHTFWFSNCRRIGKSG
jgi:hypothetical protein